MAQRSRATTTDKDEAPAEEKLDPKLQKQVDKVDEQVADEETQLNLPQMVAAGNGMSIEYGGQGNPGYVHCETCGPVGKAADVATGKLIADAHFAQVHPAAP